MAAVLRKERSPHRQPGPRVRLALRADDVLSLDDAGRPRNVGDAVLRAEDAGHVVEILTGVDRDALRLGDAKPRRVPRLILQLEDRAHRAVGDDPLALEVPGAVERIVLPDRRAAGAERLTDVEEVGAFAGVAMIEVVSLLVPLLDDRIAHALDPDVDAAAEKRIDLPQPLAVDAERDAVALPRDVVARHHVRRVDARLRRLGLRRLCLDGE